MSVRDSYRKVKGFIRSKPTLPQNPQDWQDIDIKQKSKNIWTIEVDTGETDTYSANFRTSELNFRDLYAVIDSQDKVIAFDPMITIHSPGKDRPEATPTTKEDVKEAMKAADEKAKTYTPDADDIADMLDRLPPTLGQRIGKAVDRLIGWITRR
ncbi:MAG: hypothetical protein GY771_05300 [bacterium]|nr:hypothetical protein [bacterium]